MKDYILKRPAPKDYESIALRIICPICENVHSEVYSYSTLESIIEKTSVNAFTKKCIGCEKNVIFKINDKKEIRVISSEVSNPPRFQDADSPLQNALAKGGTYDTPKDVNDLSDVMKSLSQYLQATKQDKYAKSPIDTGEDLIGPNGKIINTFQMKKYLSRYMTEGFTKSELVADLYKIIHYAMFEILRRT